MTKPGPFIIVEDDPDDQEMLRTVLADDLGIRNELIFFDKAALVLDWLARTVAQPFIILSDINMPRMSGIELRRKINENEQLRKKSIPFIFFTTTANKKDVQQAYEMTVQGYFEKPHTMDTMKQALEIIIKYWDLCVHPNSV